jgi:hypothetical protein
LLPWSCSTNWATTAFIFYFKQLSTHPYRHATKHYE